MKLPILMSALPLILNFQLEAKNFPVLKALAMIESGNNNNAIGKNGERSCYQITEVVWKTYSTLSFNHYAKDITIASEIADKHINFILRNWIKSKVGRPMTLTDFYIMWNKGVHYYQQRNFSTTEVPPKILNRAQRFSNLVILYEGKN